MAFHAVVTAFLTASIAETVNPFTASQPDWITPPRVVSAVDTADEIASHAAMTISLQFSQMKVNGRAIICPAADTTSTIS